MKLKNMKKEDKVKTLAKKIICKNKKRSKCAKNKKTEDKQVPTKSADKERVPSTSANPPQQSKKKNFKDLEFEKIMNNPATHRCAMSMLLEAKCNMQPGTAAKSATPVDEQGENDEDGKAMVEELLNRYAKNKREVVRAMKPKPKDPLLADLDIDDDEEDLIWGDDLSNNNSDFLKYVIPQLALKEKLLKKHSTKIEQLTLLQVKKLCHQVIPDLRNIKSGTLACERHEVFKRCGLSKAPVREMTIGRPFKSPQELCVMQILTDALYSDLDPTSLNFTGDCIQYISCVLVPEALLRIYASANSIPTDHAEKELRYGARYDGVLSEDLLRSMKIRKK